MWNTIDYGPTIPLACNVICEVYFQCQNWNPLYEVENLVENLKQMLFQEYKSMTLQGTRGQRIDHIHNSDIILGVIGVK